MRRLINWYKNNIMPTTSVLPNFTANFNSPANTDTVRSELLLYESIPMKKDCHQWYLKSYRVSSGQEALRALTQSKPWLYTGATDFEGIYRYICSLLNGIPMIGPLTCYDIALRLASLKNINYLPKNFVYVNSLPVIAFKKLIKKGYISYSPTVSATNVIQYATISSYFGGLMPQDIENLLCHIAKSIKRLRRKRTPAKKPLDISLDKIVSTMQLHT